MSSSSVTEPVHQTTTGKLETIKNVSFNKRLSSDYFTVACAIGISAKDIDLLVSRIDKTLLDIKSSVKE